MYRIVSYEKNDAHPKAFSSFKLAFQVQQLNYPKYIIEHWTEDGPTVVWNPLWEMNNEMEELLWNFNVEFAVQ